MHTIQIGIFTFDKETADELMQRLSPFWSLSDLTAAYSVFSSRQELEKRLGLASLHLFLLDDPGETEGLIELANILQYHDRSLRPILLSEDPARAMTGYYLNASGFLLKPVDPGLLRQVVSRCAQDFYRNQNQVVKVKLNGIWVTLPLKDVSYVESIGHILVFHFLGGGEARTQSSFRDYESVLNMNGSFLRCHKSFMVNMNAIREHDANAFTLTDGSRINISRQYKQISKSIYINYSIEQKLRASMRT